MRIILATVLLLAPPFSGPPPPPGLHTGPPPPPGLVQPATTPVPAAAAPEAPEMPPNPTARPVRPPKKTVLLERAGRLRKHAYGLAAAGSIIFVVGVFTTGVGALAHMELVPLVAGGVLMGTSVALFIPAIATGVASRVIRKKAQTVRLIPNGIAF